MSGTVNCQEGISNVEHAHFAADAADLVTTQFRPEMPPLKTFADVDSYIQEHPDWRDCSRGSLRSICRGVAWRVNAILAGEHHEPFDPNPKKLDLATVPFDIAMINAAWSGRSYRAAGFTSERSFRNARWAIRRVGRAAGMVVPCVAPPLPPGDPFGPLLLTLNKYDKPAAGLFAAWCRWAGLLPSDIDDAVLIRYRTHVMTYMVGKPADEVIRLIARLWNSTARRDAAWPQMRLSAPCLLERYSLPLTAFPASFQNSVAALVVWMAGTKRRHAPGHREGRKLAMRPTSVNFRLYCIRWAAWALVAGGRDPSSITDLDCLVTETDMEAILLYYEERARIKQLALPEADRVPNPHGSTAQTHAIGATLLMIAQYREVSPDKLKVLRALAADFRVPIPDKPTLKNRRRVYQFLNDRAKLKRLMRLPRTLMDEALTLRDASARAVHEAGLASADEATPLTHKAAVMARRAAYLSREAVLIGILCRIPLRIKNLHEIRIGTNLLFAGGGSNVVRLCFTEAETKTRIDLEFYVGPRLHELLRTYIDHFQPFFAADAVDFKEKRWLFPSCRRPGPLSIEQMRKIIVRTVADNVGATINPHLFRALAVTLALEHSPDALDHCRLLLGDKTLTIILRHYAMLQQMDAARRQSAFVDAEEDRLAQVLAPPHVKRKGRQS
jgi:integrase